MNTGVLFEMTRVGRTLSKRASPSAFFLMRDLYFFLHMHTPLLTGARTHTYTLLPRRSADTLQLETSGAKQLVALIHTPPRSLVKA